MALRTMLKYLLKINVILGIHQNYCTRSKIKKYLIIFHVLLQLCVHTSVVIEEIYLAWTKPSAAVVIYCAIAMSAYVSIAPSYITAIYNSHTFISFLESIDRVANSLKNDNKTVKSKNVSLWVTIIMTIVTITCVLLKSLDFTRVVTERDAGLVIYMLMSHLLLRTTIAFQYITFFVAIMIVVKYTKRLEVLIIKVQRSVQCNGIDERNIIKKEKIEEWAQVYLDLANSCENVSLCFGRQYFYSLYLFLCYYILFSYQLCCVRHSTLTPDYKQILLVILNYMLVLIMPLLGGQMAVSQGRNIHRSVTRFYNAIVVPDSLETEAKKTKDFIRLIKKRPLQIQMLSNVPAGVYILPAILSLAVNYLIILLQFNHII